MASSKVMASSSSNSRNSDLTTRPSHHHHNHHHPPPSPMISDQRSNNDLASSVSVDGILQYVYGENPRVSSENTLLDAEITLIDAAGAISAGDDTGAGAEPAIRRQNSHRRTVDDVLRERKECKVEALEDLVTLEEFLAKNGASMEVEDEEEEDVKATVSTPLMAERLSGELFGFDPLAQRPYLPPPPQPAMAEGSVIGFGNGGMEVVVAGRGKRRGGPILEPLDKAAQQRQRRMIKNRESAARSRERKQAYQVELEALALKLEEENEQLLREKAELTKENYKQLMEKVVPVVEKRKPRRVLRRVRSLEW